MAANKKLIVEALAGGMSPSEAAETVKIGLRNFGLLSSLASSPCPRNCQGSKMVTDVFSKSQLQAGTNVKQP